MQRCRALARIALVRVVPVVLPKIFVPSLLAAVCLSSWAAETVFASCPLRVTPAEVSRCALAGSLTLRAQGQAVSAANARLTSAGVVLPSLPRVGVAAGGRGGADGGLAWSVSVSQELELGGQRQARLSSVDSELEAAQVMTASVRRDVLAAAWVAWFDLVAHHAEVDLARVEAAAVRDVAVSVRARANRGVASTVDGEIAEAAALESERGRLQAEEQVAQSQVALAMALGLPTGTDLDADGALTPLPEDPSLTGSSPTAAALRAESRSLTAQADVARRSATPNLTVSAIAQQEQTAQTAFLVGVGLPIPLPGSWGRNYTAEAAEFTSLSQRVALVANQTERQFLSDIELARRTLAARRAELSLYTADRLVRARQQLAQLAVAVESGRLGVRDAMQARQVLTALLRGELNARINLCRASVALARLTGSIEKELP